jgi:hypothetical protein
MKAHEKLIKLLSLIESNEVLNSEYEKENLDIIINPENKVPYIVYGSYEHIYSQMNSYDYKNWKSKLAYHFKKENLIFDNITSLNHGYTIKEFI